MNTQELIQEAAVIRDERNQYANTAERVGTALVHMAEQIAAQGADVDKIEADVRGALTLSQLDNPFGFTTVAQWMQGLRGEQSYTFRLVAPTGRCIGHVWLFNDYDNPSNSNLAARTLEVVMCCASINSDTGALTYDGIKGSPRIYYRSYCAPLTGGTPDGGSPIGNKWSLWQEYREYVAKPIKDSLAALQQQHDTDVAALQKQHATDVSELQASIDATLAAIPTGVLNIGMSADADTILAEAAKYAVASDPFKAVITGQYMVGTAVQSIVIHQQVTKNSNGSGVCMQYVYKDKARFTRYINFNAAASVTAVQTLQPDGVRNLYYTDTGFIGQRDEWGTQVGSGFFLPNKNDLREGTPTATSVPLVLTKAIKDTVTCNLGPATTARAGVMTVEQVNQLADAKAKADKEASSHYYLEGTYADLDGIIEALKELPEVLTDERVRYIHATSPDDYVYEVFIFKIMDVMEPYGGTYNVNVTCYAFSNIGIGKFSISYDVDEATGSFSLGSCSDLSSIEPFGLNNQTDGDLVKIGLTNLNGEVISTILLDIATADHGGIMSAQHVLKLANLEARIAALEAK